MEALGELALETGVALRHGGQRRLAGDLGAGLGLTAPYFLFCIIGFLV